MADEGFIRFSTLMEFVCVWGAIIHNIRPPSNQQAAAPGAGQSDEKHLKISAFALALVNRNWMMKYNRNDSNYCVIFKYMINSDLLHLPFQMSDCHKDKI